MKTSDVLLIAGIGVLAWWLLGRKKPLEAKDMTNTKPLGSGAAPTEIPAVDAMVKSPVTVEDLSSRRGANQRDKKSVRIRNPRVVKAVENPVVKGSLTIERTNVNPSVYNDEIGLTIEKPTIVHATSDYQNFIGNTSSIQKVCRCTSKTDKRYRTNLPQMP
jgi:hypothetical protein